MRNKFTVLLLFLGINGSLLSMDQRPPTRTFEDIRRDRLNVEKKKKMYEKEIERLRSIKDNEPLLHYNRLQTIKSLENKNKEFDKKTSTLYTEEWDLQHEMSFQVLKKTLQESQKKN